MAEDILPENVADAKKEAARARARRQRINNPESVKRATEKWRAKNRDKMLATMKAWRTKNAEKRKAYADALYAENKEYFQERSRQRRKTHPESVKRSVQAWREKNHERHREAEKIRTKRFFAKHPEAARAYTEARRARKAAAKGRHTGEDIQRILAAQKQKCAYCRKKLVANKWHCDHIMPLALGGNNEASNIQLLCPTCNRRKSATHPIAFAQKLGLLL